MTTIVGISGSLRSGSFDSALLRAAAASLPDSDIPRIFHGRRIVGKRLETAGFVGFVRAGSAT